MNKFKVFFVVFLGLLLTACVSSNAGNVYKRSEARGLQNVSMGVVESVRSVKIEGTDTKMGMLSGAALGGVAGNALGGGRGRVATTIAGAVVGGLIGNVVEDKVTSKDGIEITVKLDRGDLVAVVQEATETFVPGDRVRVIGNGGTARVSR